MVKALIEAMEKNLELILSKYLGEET